MDMAPEQRPPCRSRAECRRDRMAAAQANSRRDGEEEYTVPFGAEHEARQPNRRS